MKDSYEIQSRRFGGMIERCVKKHLKSTRQEINKLMTYAITSAYTNDVRSLLLWESYCLNAGKTLARAIPLCTAVHLANVSSVIADDIVDQTDQAQIRDKIVVREKFGNAGAITAAMSFFHLSLEILDRYKSYPHYPVMRAELLNAHRKTFESFYLEDVYEKRSIDRVSLRDYYSLVGDYATSPMFRLSLVMGALLAGNIQKQMLDAVSDFGTLLGILAQVRDDFIDYIPNRKLTGKNSYEDIMAKKKRFPILMAYRAGTKKEQRYIKRLFGQKNHASKNDILKIGSIISSENIERATMTETEPLYKKAKFALETMFTISGRTSQTLIHLLDFFAMRT